MKHILVVDDDKLNLLMAKEALGNHYKITAVTMGVQALKYLENNTCDLILLDINMPGMDGFEVMSHIKTMDSARNIPIIFLTADNEAAVESRCLEEGAQDFITKPFVNQVILSRISRTLELEELRANLAEKLEKKTKEYNDIQSIAQKDSLTGLWNRSYTEKLVNERLSNNFHGAIFMLDMDNFKAINDNYGHLAGDKTLKMFAETLEQFAEEADILCRIGGDEFIVFVSDTSDEEKLAKRARNIISSIVSKINECNFETNSSVSVGIAVYPSDGEDFSSLYNSADKALYHVKLNGKNSFHFYSDAKKADKERSETTVDLDYIKDLMHRSDVGKGTYNLNFENFHHMYNFLSRFVQRSHNQVHTLLFTAQSIGNRVIDNEDLEKALSALEDSIYTSLRKVDISTRYSNRQLIVILLDANKENSEIIAKRIIENYSKEYQNTSISFSYDIAKIGEP